MPTRITTPWDGGYKQPFRGAELAKAHPLREGIVAAWVMNGRGDGHR
jgi:hypothetical protein